MTSAMRASTLRFLFVAAILGGSFLLFLVQPMVARMALPRLGGAPAVWNSAMLVYQALLLAGYGYAHWLGRAPVRRQAAIHLAVVALAALWLPIGLSTMTLPERAEPALWVPWLLCASIGPLFFAVSAQAPLLQRWYAAAAPDRDPYALYAASNIGSFGGLLAYPLLVEPALRLQQQSWLWTGGYLAVALLVAACATRLPRGRTLPAETHEGAPPGWRRIGHWIALAFVPSGLMLATTTFLTTDIVAAPLLWVLPLSLYLLSFSIAFRFSGPILLHGAAIVPALLLFFSATMIAGHSALAYANAAIGLAVLFAVSLLCHARLYALRPAPDRLTGFYLAMAVGGMFGGVFAGLIAPVLFDWTYEYPLLILAAGMLMPQHFLLPALARLWRGRQRRTAMLVAIVAIGLLLAIGLGTGDRVLGPLHVQLAFMAVAAIGLVAMGERLPYMLALAAGLVLFGGYDAIRASLEGTRTRSYFGVYTITDTPDERRLAHGTTLHGIQLKGSRSRLPTTYYVQDSGVGRAMRAAPALFGSAARIGVVGLGTGTLACYRQPRQRWTFYEIDPAVVRIARDSDAFTFLAQCAPDARIVVGDARLSLRDAAAASLDLLALDAFSSDAIPMHLMTAEAFATYGRVLAGRGLLLVHISNRFLDLAPVVAAAARAGGWHALRLVHVPSTSERADEGDVSEWIAMSRSQATIAGLVSQGGAWRPLVPRPGFAGWTDDFASLLPVIRLFHRAPEVAD